ncbi:unnamed protein product [Camellia sinensis]
MKLAEETWGKQKDAEKAAFDEAEKKREEEVLFFVHNCCYLISHLINLLHFFYY